VQKYNQGKIFEFDDVMTPVARNLVATQRHHRACCYPARLCALNMASWVFLLVTIPCIMTMVCADTITTPWSSSGVVHSRDQANGRSSHQPSVRLMVIGDSLSSCSGVSVRYDSAYLSFRRPLWHQWTSFCRGQAKGTDARSSIGVVGPRLGCNSKLSARFPPAKAFPDVHDAFFGRTTEQALTYWTDPRDSSRLFRYAALSAADAWANDSMPTTHKDSTTTVMIVLVWLGTNDLMAEASHTHNHHDDVLVVNGIVARLLALGEAVVDRAVDNMRRTLPHAGSEYCILFGHVLDVRRKTLKWRRSTYAAFTQQRLALNARLDAAVRDWLWCRNQSCDRNVRVRASVVAFPHVNATLHTYDGLHLNSEGEEVVARAWFGAMRRSLGQDGPALVDGGGLVSHRQREFDSSSSVSTSEPHDDGVSMPAMTSSDGMRDIPLFLAASMVTVAMLTAVRRCSRRPP